MPRRSLVAPRPAPEVVLALLLILAAAGAATFFLKSPPMEAANEARPERVPWLRGASPR